MIPFPPPWPRLALLQKASALAAISVLPGIPCFSPRCCLTSALRQFLRFRSRPSAASRSQCAPRASACPALPSSFPPIARFRPAVLAMARCLSTSPADRFPIRLPLPAEELPVAHLHSFSAAAGRLHSSRRCDKPTFRNWRFLRTAAISGTPAKTPPAPLLRRRANFPSSDTPSDERKRYAARPARDRLHARQPASAPRRPRR